MDIVTSGLTVDTFRSSPQIQGTSEKAFNKHASVQYSKDKSNA